jgi:hypothetical protein
MVSELLGMWCKISDSAGKFSGHCKVTGDLWCYDGELRNYHVEFV